MSERRRNMEKLLIMEGCEHTASRLIDESEHRIKSSLTAKAWRKQERAGGQRNVFLIFLSFLFGMRLSFEFFNLYARTLSSNDRTTTTPFSTMFYDTVRAEWNDVGATILQEAERTSEFLRQTVNHQQNDDTMTTTIDTTVTKVDGSGSFLASDDECGRPARDEHEAEGWERGFRGLQAEHDGREARQ